MKIRINDPNICDSCQKRTCSMIDSVEKVLFAVFKSERYTCPLRILQNGPADDELDNGLIDVSSSNRPDCIYCLLCVGCCSQNNLSVENDKENVYTTFHNNAAISEKSNPGICNILATSYLNYIFGFSANTNLNRSLTFDGFICDSKNGWYFVEVDADNDSLESCRRLLGDILLQNHMNQRKVNAGVMVLNDLPKEGSRDVFSLIESIKNFPDTAHLRIYLTTFLILRNLYVQGYRNMDVPSLLMDMTSESLDDYRKRMLEKNIMDGNLADYLFCMDSDDHHNN